MKPSFFLADLISRRTVEGYDIYIAGSEHARDLRDYPAMLQDKTIYVRVDTTRLLLWENMKSCALTELTGLFHSPFRNMTLDQKKNRQRKFTGVYPGQHTPR